MLILFRTMSNVQVCDFADGLVDEVKKFRFSKAKCSRAIIMKIDIQKQLVSLTHIFTLIPQHHISREKSLLILV